VSAAGREHVPDEVGRGALDSGMVLDHVQEFAHVGFWDLDLGTEELYWSTQVFQILRTQTASIESFLAAVHPDDIALVRQVNERVRAQPGPYRMRHRTADGERLLDHRMQAVAGPNGTPERVIGVVIDVTQEWRLERELEEASSARLTGLLAGGAVHDLKNIFAVLLGHAQLATEADEQGLRPARESLEAIQRAAANGIELTNQLLQVGRTDAVSVRRADVVEVFERLAATARTALGRHRRVHVDAGRGGVELLVDPTRLERAVVDLLLNTRDALPDDGGSVQLTFRVVELGAGHTPLPSFDLPAGTYGIVEVADDGAGMTSDVLARVTDPFFTTKGRAHGSGVGLSSVARFVESAGGALAIDSDPGAGTRVRLVVPARRFAPSEGSTSGRGRPMPVRALILGVDHDRLERICGHLREAGIQCVVATTTGAAANVLRSEPIDLVLVDVVVGTAPDEADLLRVAASTATPVLSTADIGRRSGPSAPPIQAQLDEVEQDVRRLVARGAQRVWE